MTITSVPRRQFSHDNAIRDFLSGSSDPSSLPAPQWGPIGQEVYERTYSRDLKTETGTRKETWAETVRRVVLGNLSYVTPDHWLEDEAVDLFDTIYNFRAIPAGRHLWVTGTESGHMSRNCFISGFSPRTSDHFRFLAARLFEGGGVGANYSFDLVGITQPILGTLTIQFMCDSSHRDSEQVQRAAGSRFKTVDITDPDVEYVRVEDTREGWVDTWVYLIDLATTEGQHRVVLDVSDIRPHGAPLKTFGGTASGPEPLVTSIAGIVTVLNHAAQGGRRLTGLEAMQMDHEIAASVVAGGARRCLPAGTRVHTSRGPVKIEDVQVGDIVQTSAGEAPVTAVFDQGRQDTIRIKHEFGVLECTPNHRVAVFDSLTSWTFKEARDITPLDHLVWDFNGCEGDKGSALPPHDAVTTLPVLGDHRRANGRPVTGTSRFNTPCYVDGCPDTAQVMTPQPICNRHYLRQKKHGNPLVVEARRTQISIPELDADTAWFVGLLHGDGNVDGQDTAHAMVRVACDPAYPRVISDAKTLLGRFGIDHVMTQGPKPDNGCVIVTARRLELARWVAANVKTAHSPLSVPEYIWQGTREVRAAYLAGVFDADGSWKTRPLQIVTTCYEGFADDLVRVAASLGIAAYKKPQRKAENPNGWQATWAVNVAGQDSLYMIDSWFSVYSRKYENVGRTVEGHKGFGFSKDFGRSQGLKVYGGEKNLKYSVRVTERLGKTELPAWPVAVLGIESGRENVQTYDIEVDGLHQFTAEGLVVHNSARMSIMSWKDPEVFDFISCKSNDQLHHWSTNISVEIDDEFRDAVDAGGEHAEAVLAAVAVGMATNGEPGIVDTHAHSADEDTAIRSTNPCVTGDTWVQTTSGLRQVDDLVGSGEVELLVNDEVWSTSKVGFFPTGTKRVLKVDVDGTPIRVTEDHLISTPDGWQTAGSLAVGDAVNLTDSLGNSWSGPGTEAEGYLLGHLIGDGHFNPPNKNGAPGSANLCAWHSDEGSESVKQYILDLIDEAGLAHRVDWSDWHQVHGGDKQELRSAALRDLAQRFGITHHHKTVTEQVMGASSDFVTGLLRALFDTDGHIEGISTSGGISVRLSQSDYDMLGKVRTLLLALGIKSSVRFCKGAGWKEMPGGTYWTKDCFRLIVAGRHVERFSKLIGFANEAKTAKLDASMQEMPRGFYDKPMVGTIQSIAQDGVEQVYDCQVPGLNAFVANGTIVHNCGEVSLNFDPTDAAGESCNLGSVDLAAFGTDHEGALQAFRLMARFLYRATLNPHHEEAVRRIETINRRIGVGIMGLQGWVAAHDAKLTELTHRTDLLDQMVAFRSMARASADQLADELGLPRPVKVTAVAPTGTIAQMRGTTPGINAVMARYFIRRVRYADTDTAVAELEAAGHTVVDDIYAANTKVVEFVVRDGILDHYPVGLIEQSDEISAPQFFSVIAAIQEHFCGWGDGQAVSATAQIPAGMDPSELVSAIRPYLGRVKGLTVFPAISRDLSPYEAITEDQYNSLAASGPVQSFGDSNSGECIGASCPIR